MNTKKSLCLLFLAILVFSLIGVSTGCQQHRVVAQSGDPVQIDYHSVQHDRYFWGLTGDPAITAQCKSHGLYDVRVSTGFRQAMATTFTLGIWTPATVEWRCATVAATPVTPPIPPDRSGRE